jgi:predicted choloylglycine hydrolase
MSHEEKEFPIPLFTVSGSSYGEVGYEIGRLARERIVSAFEVRREWVSKLMEFMEADPRTRLDPFLAALREELPRLEEELRGIGEGAGAPFTQVLAAFLNPELSALMKISPAPGGCTSVGLNSGDKLWIGHNEDGSCSYQGHMYLLDIRWPSGIRSWCLCYPGYLPGNGPTVNSRGLVQTVNFIGAREVRPGLPRYAIDRAIMEARSMDEAVALATHPKRAYSQHHLLMSAREKRLVSIEAGADQYSLIEVEGIFVHANHFVHPRLKSVPQIEVYKSSSLPRQEVAEKWAASSDPVTLTAEDVMGILASHENRPLSICRHPAPRLTGCTLGSVLVRAGEERLAFYADQPCLNMSREFAWPQ